LLAQRGVPIIEAINLEELTRGVPALAIQRRTNYAQHHSPSPCPPGRARAGLSGVPYQRIRHTDKFDDPNLPGAMHVTIIFKRVSGGPR